MPLLDDHRLDLQKAAIVAQLAARAERGQLTGYLDYASQVREWLARLTDGRPLTVSTAATDADRAELADLVDFLTTTAIDLSVQEQLVQDLTQALQSHREQVLRQSRAWDPQLDVLSSTLTVVQQRFEQQGIVAVTEPFTRTTTGTLGRLAAIDETRGLLSLRPDATVRATSALHRADVTLYPVHNPHGGIHHVGSDDLNPTLHPQALVDGPGFEQWVLSDIAPSVTLDGVTYEGALASIDLVYEGAVTFTAIEFHSRGAYPLDVVRVQAQSTTDGAWLDVLATGQQPLTGITDGIYWVRGLPRTTASRVRIWVRQAHAESRSPTVNPHVYTQRLSALEHAAQVVANAPGSHRLYVIGAYRIHLLDLTYPSLGTGVFWSHDPATPQGYEIDQEPIETVSVIATLETPEQSTIEWWVRDVDRSALIPLLPTGTTRVRERVVFIPEDDLLLTFPIARGTTPQIFVNGVPLDHAQFPVTEVNSTRLRIPLWHSTGQDVATIEYTPAIGQTAMVYVVQSRTSDTITIRGALTTANAVFPNRAEADRAIAETSDPNLLESYGVLARLDEFDTWFVDGALEDNTGHTTLTIPRVYAHPDLEA